MSRAPELLRNFPESNHFPSPSLVDNLMPHLTEPLWIDPDSTTTNLASSLNYQDSSSVSSSYDSLAFACINLAE